MAKKDDGGGLLLGGALLGGAALLLFSRKAQAGGKFTCLYGDGLSFATIKELQDHVAAAHPGERIPIVITWG
jgi:hypothetical protein